MEIILYRNLSEPNRLQKTLTRAAQVNGYMRDNSSVINPVIRLQMSSDIAAGYDYLYIPAWNRYYFINDYDSIRTDITDISCRVDVLMSFKSDIENLTVIVDKQSNLDIGNKYLNDGSWMHESRSFYTIRQFPSGFNEQGTYILITAG